MSGFFIENSISVFVARPGGMDMGLRSLSLGMSSVRSTVDEAVFVEFTVFDLYTYASVKWMWGSKALVLILASSIWRLYLSKNV